MRRFCCFGLIIDDPSAFIAEQAAPPVSVAMRRFCCFGLYFWQFLQWQLAKRFSRHAAILLFWTRMSDRSSWLGAEFQSPCGDSVVLDSPVVDLQWSGNTFQSPCGDSVVLDEQVLAVIGGLVLLFQSPCGDSVVLDDKAKDALAQGFSVSVAMRRFCCFGRKRVHPTMSVPIRVSVAMRRFCCFGPK
jgi:hypothetical protein